MNCHQIQEQLSLYLDNRLDNEKRREVEDHLASCPICLPEAKLLSDGIKRVAGLSEIEPPAGFSQRIMTRIRSEAETPTLWARFFQPLTIKLPLHATALLLVVGLAVYLYRSNEPGQRETIAPSKQSDSSSSLNQGEAEPIKPQRKEDAPVMAAPSAPPEPQRFADSNQTAAETDRPEASEQEKRAPSGPAQGLMKSKESRSNTESASGPASRRESVAPDPVSPDAALTLSPHEATDKTAALTSRMKQTAERSGGKVFALIKESPEGALELNYWLNLPKSEYGRFKADLSQIGQILSESQPSSFGPRSDLRPSSSIRVRVTVIVENSKGSEPAAPPSPN